MINVSGAVPHVEALFRVTDAIKIENPMERRITASKLCVDLKSLINWDFDFKSFHDGLCDLPHLPLEIIWNLHMYQVMPLQKYLLSVKSKNILPKLKDSVCTFVLDDLNDDWSFYFLQAGILSYLVREAFPSSDKSGEEFIQICQSIIRNLLQAIFSLEENEINFNRLKPLFSLWSCGTLEIVSLHSFCYFALCQFLSEVKTAETDAFVVQENWKTKSNPFHIFPIIEKLIEILKPNEVEQILSQALSDENTNWKNFVVTISAVNSNNEVSSIIKTFVSTLIKNGFDQLNAKSFQRALLIGRQINLKENVTFPSAYGLWYQKNIGYGIHLRNPEAVSLLIQVLSDLIPYEKNIDCIKVYLERPMNVPHQCQSIHSDYVTLLKTRVKDLQPRVNTAHVLEKVLKTYSETGKIPPYILEASLMHKHHYLNEFLPALLTPRVIPFPLDTKEKFIEELNKAGKVPSNFLEKYRHLCELEQHNLIADLNMADIDFDSDDDIQIID